MVDGDGDGDGVMMMLMFRLDFLAAEMVRGNAGPVTWQGCGWLGMGIHTVWYPREEVLFEIESK